MCYTRAELEKLYNLDESRQKEDPKELEVGKVEEVERFEHLPSSLPIHPAVRDEPTLVPS
jgi:hypothetical protein